METHLKIIGTALIVLALFHAVFPRYFNWKQDLKPLTLINRQVMKVHTFFIALTVFLMGLLCLTSSHELLTTPLGKKLMIGLALFWTTRLFVQVFIYSPRLWRGKVFETIIHIVFSLLWIYISTLFFLAAFIGQ